MYDLCFYHGIDHDGHMSGAIVRDFYMNHKPDVELRLYGIDYGRSIPWSLINGCDDIIVVDFSFEPSDMKQILNHHKVTIIDHHKTDIDKYATVEHDNLTKVMTSEYAGCELTWNHFNPTLPMPDVVRYCGRYDVWDHSDENTLKFHYGAMVSDTRPFVDGNLFSQFLALDNPAPYITNILDAGDVIMEYESQQNAIYAHASFILPWEGVRFLALNRMCCNSKVLDSKFDPDIHDAVLLFGYNGKFKNFKVSMYTSKPDLDLSHIANRYGGGGHAKACGFICRSLPFELDTDL